MLRYIFKNWPGLSSTVDGPPHRYRARLFRSLSPDLRCNYTSDNRSVNIESSLQRSRSCTRTYDDVKQTEYFSYLPKHEKFQTGYVTKNKKEDGQKPTNQNLQNLYSKRKSRELEDIYSTSEKYSVTPQFASKFYTGVQYELEAARPRKSEKNLTLHVIKKMQKFDMENGEATDYLQPRKTQPFGSSNNSLSPSSKSQPVRSLASPKLTSRMECELAEQNNKLYDDLRYRQYSTTSNTFKHELESPVELIQNLPIGGYNKPKHFYKPRKFDTMNQEGSVSLREKETAEEIREKLIGNKSKSISNSNLYKVPKQRQQFKLSSGKKTVSIQTKERFSTPSFKKKLSTFSSRSNTTVDARKNSSLATNKDNNYKNNFKSISASCRLDDRHLSTRNVLKVTPERLTKKNNQKNEFLNYVLHKTFKKEIPFGSSAQQKLQSETKEISGNYVFKPISSADKTIKTSIRDKKSSKYSYFEKVGNKKNEQRDASKTHVLLSTFTSPSRDYVQKAITNAPLQCHPNRIDYISSDLFTKVKTNSVKKKLTQTSPMHDNTLYRSEIESNTNPKSRTLTKTNLFLNKGGISEFSDLRRDSLEQSRSTQVSDPFTEKLSIIKSKKSFTHFNAHGSTEAKKINHISDMEDLIQAATKAGTIYKSSENPVEKGFSNSTKVGTAPLVRHKQTSSDSCDKNDSNLLKPTNDVNVENLLYRREKKFLPIYSKSIIKENIASPDNISKDSVNTKDSSKYVNTESNASRKLKAVPGNSPENIIKAFSTQESPKNGQCVIKTSDRNEHQPKLNAGQDDIHQNPPLKLIKFPFRAETKRRKLATCVNRATEYENPKRTEPPIHTNSAHYKLVDLNPQNDISTQFVKTKRRVMKSSLIDPLTKLEFHEPEKVEKRSHGLLNKSITEVKDDYDVLKEQKTTTNYERSSSGESKTYINIAPQSPKQKDLSEVTQTELRTIKIPDTYKGYYLKSDDAALDNKLSSEDHIKSNRIVKSSEKVSQASHKRESHILELPPMLERALHSKINSETSSITSAETLARADIEPIKNNLCKNSPLKSGDHISKAEPLTSAQVVYDKCIDSSRKDHVKNKKSTKISYANESSRNPHLNKSVKNIHKPDHQPFLDLRPEVTQKPPPNIQRGNELNRDANMKESQEIDSKLTLIDGVDQITQDLSEYTDTQLKSKSQDMSEPTRGNVETCQQNNYSKCVDEVYQQVACIEDKKHFLEFPPIQGGKHNTEVPTQQYNVEHTNIPDSLNQSSTSLNIKNKTADTQGFLGLSQAPRIEITLDRLSRPCYLENSENLSFLSSFVKVAYKKRDDDNIHRNIAIAARKVLDYISSYQAILKKSFPSSTHQSTERSEHNNTVVPLTTQTCVTNHNPSQTYSESGCAQNVASLLNKCVVQENSLKKLLLSLILPKKTKDNSAQDIKNSSTITAVNSSACELQDNVKFLLHEILHASPSTLPFISSDKLDTIIPSLKTTSTSYPALQNRFVQIRCPVKSIEGVIDSSACALVTPICENLRQGNITRCEKPYETKSSVKQLNGPILLIDQKVPNNKNISNNQPIADKIQMESKCGEICKVSNKIPPSKLDVIIVDKTLKKSILNKPLIERKYSDRQKVCSAELQIGQNTVLSKNMSTTSHSKLLNKSHKHTKCNHVSEGTYTMEAFKASITSSMEQIKKKVSNKPLADSKSPSKVSNKAKKIDASKTNIPSMEKDTSKVKHSSPLVNSKSSSKDFNIINIDRSSKVKKRYTEQNVCRYMNHILSPVSCIPERKIVISSSPYPGVVQRINANIPEHWSTKKQNGVSSHRNYQLPLKYTTCRNSIASCTLNKSNENSSIVNASILDARHSSHEVRHTPTNLNKEEPTDSLVKISTNVRKYASRNVETNPIATLKLLRKKSKIYETSSVRDKYITELDENTKFTQSVMSLKKYVPVERSLVVNQQRSLHDISYNCKSKDSNMRLLLKVRSGHNYQILYKKADKNITEKREIGSNVLNDIIETNEKWNTCRNTIYLQGRHYNFRTRHKINGRTHSKHTLFKRYYSSLNLNSYKKITDYRYFSTAISTQNLSSYTHDKNQYSIPSSSNKQMNSMLNTKHSSEHSKTVCTKPKIYQTVGKMRKSTDDKCSPIANVKPKSVRYVGYDECVCMGEDGKQLQPKYPILPEIETVSTTNPLFPKSLNSRIKEEYIRHKYGIVNEGVTLNCEDFKESITPNEITTEDCCKKKEIVLDKNQIPNNDSVSEIKPKMSTALCCSPVNSEDTCEVNKNALVATNTTTVNKNISECSERPSPKCKIRRKAESTHNTFKRAKPPILATPKDPTCPIDHCKQLDPCEPSKKKNNTSNNEPTLWDRIVDYFKARPNCPAPDEWKKKAIREKAERYAKAAGLCLYDPKQLEDKCKPKFRKRKTKGERSCSCEQKRGSPNSRRKECEELPRVITCQPHDQKRSLSHCGTEKLMQGNKYNVSNQSCKKNSTCLPANNMNIHKKYFSTSSKYDHNHKKDDSSEPVTFDSLSTDSQQDTIGDAFKELSQKVIDGESEGYDSGAMKINDTDDRSGNNTSANASILDSGCCSEKFRNRNIDEINATLDEKEKEKLAETIIRSLLEASINQRQADIEDEEESQADFHRKHGYEQENFINFKYRTLPRDIILSEAMFREPLDEYSKYCQARSFANFLDGFHKMEVLSDMNYEDLEKMKTNKLINELNKLITDGSKTEK